MRYLILVAFILTLSSAEIILEDNSEELSEYELSHSASLQNARKCGSKNPKAEPDEDLCVQELITKYDYPVETHFVTTSDGYILQMHRIPPTKAGVTPNGKVVFLMHGLLMSSADWVILGPGKALAYILADKGYDIWMGNARGNTQSRNHTHLNPNRAKFWEFSWHEIGVKDLPAMIDYVLKKTGQKAIYHVGHSQGTTTFYIMASELPHYNKRIIAHYSLAPIAYMKHMFSPILKLISFWVGNIAFITKLIGMNEFMPSNFFMQWAGDHFCKETGMFSFACENALFLICGFNKAEFNRTLLPTIMSHTPAGASTRQLLHYGQGIKSGKFRQYDHGFLGNLAKYGHHTPPKYNLKKITAPVNLIYSKNDWLSNVKDVDKLCKDLKNCASKVLVEEHTFNHLDYLLGKNADKYVYDEILHVLTN